MHRAGRTGQVVNLIHLQKDGLHHVVPDELKAVVRHQVPDVVLAAGEEIVQADHLMPLI
jgi:hypothetical protein